MMKISHRLYHKLTIAIAITALLLSQSFLGCHILGSQITAMSDPTQSSVCFDKSGNLFKEGKISYEQHVRNALSHLFAGVRHSTYEDREGYSDADVQAWISREPLVAATLVCILSRAFKPSSEEENAEVEDILVKMLASIKDVTLSKLQAMDSNSVSVLNQPIFYQLLVCIALDHGNRKLVREMIASGSPGPKVELLFSPPSLHYGLRYPLFHKDLIIDGQIDNGCELYITMIKKGWALPREYMQSWAASASNNEAGIKLIDVLVEHNIKINDHAIFSAVSEGQVAMLEHLLTLNTTLPSTPERVHHLLRCAAGRKVNGVEFLEFFFKYGLNDINWMAPFPLKKPAARDIQELPPLSATVLHSAAETGEPATVEWLINHSAERKKNYWGRDQVEVAKWLKREDILAVFQKHPGWELAVEKKSACCSIL